METDVHKFSVPLHPFVFVEHWMRMVGDCEYNPGAGGVPTFSAPSDRWEYLITVATVVRGDGTLNGSSHHAERFALCLDNEGNSVEALELFLAIAHQECGCDIFLIHKPPQNGLYHSSAVADRRGMLGYEGMYRFAELAKRYNNHKMAEKLFYDIVEKIPTECYPTRLQDIRIKALENLQDFGVTTLGSRTSIAQELRAAKRFQEHQG